MTKKWQDQSKHETRNPTTNNLNVTDNVKATSSVDKATVTLVVYVQLHSTVLMQQWCH